MAAFTGINFCPKPMDKRETEIGKERVVVPKSRMSFLLLILGNYWDTRAPLWPQTTYS